MSRPPWSTSTRPRFKALGRSRGCAAPLGRAGEWRRAWALDVEAVDRVARVGAKGTVRGGPWPEKYIRGSRIADSRLQKAHGLAGVELTISDAHVGLREAIASSLPGTAWQRCRPHVMRPLAQALDKGGDGGQGGLLGLGDSYWVKTSPRRVLDTRRLRHHPRPF